ncbi:MAG: hypothetical protein KatS3mg003_0673 [Candidatus Nitrosocaldaceae archaeon]|nr:MAG: hypothetical protein KatS3mg003_0673 [Candidatus Nitrosocaldaceae archaeon]
MRFRCKICNAILDIEETINHKSKHAIPDYIKFGKRIEDQITIICKACNIKESINVKDIEE